MSRPPTRPYRGSSKWLAGGRDFGGSSIGRRFGRFLAYPKREPAKSIGSLGRARANGGNHSGFGRSVPAPVGRSRNAGHGECAGLHVDCPGHDDTGNSLWPGFTHSLRGHLWRPLRCPSLHPLFGDLVRSGTPSAFAVATVQGWGNSLYWRYLAILVAELIAANACTAAFVWQKHWELSGSTSCCRFLRTWLWGPIGLILSTPSTVVMVVLGKYVPSVASGRRLLVTDRLWTDLTSSKALARDPDGGRRASKRFLRFSVTKTI